MKMFKTEANVSYGDPPPPQKKKIKKNERLCLVTKCGFKTYSKK